MNKLQRLAVITEFESCLAEMFVNVSKEIVFNKIMPTKRRFRADYFCYNVNAIIEVNGGQWVKGRHNRGGKGYENDLIKMNLAITNGFFYLQYTYEMIERKEYLSDFEKIMKSYSPF